MHQILFIEGESGLGKTTLAKALHQHYRGVYLEQYMISDFQTKDGKTEINGREEDETLYQLMKANIKEFARLGYHNIIALDFNPVRFCDIPVDFMGYDYLIIRLSCADKKQHWQQMKNREKGGLVDKEMLEEDWRRKEKFPKPTFPNQIDIDITGKSKEQIFEEAVEKIDMAQAALEYEYEMPDRRCFSTWVLADKIDV